MPRAVTSCCDHQVALVRDELELKMKVLALPLDICLSAAVKGQSSLQGVLDVALKILQDIERFEDNLRNQTLSKVNAGSGWPLAVRQLRCLAQTEQLSQVLPEHWDTACPPLTSLHAAQLQDLGLS